MPRTRSSRSQTVRPPSKKGTDYIVGGIRNNKGKRICIYQGYRQIRRIRSRTYHCCKQDIGKRKRISSKSANYLTYANKAKSSYIGIRQLSKSSTQKGGTYTLTDDMNVRKGAGTTMCQVKRSKLEQMLKKKQSQGKVCSSQDRNQG